MLGPYGSNVVDRPFSWRNPRLVAGAWDIPEKFDPAIGLDRGATLFLVAMRAVGAATACGAGAGPATALVGVVETAAVELNATGRERLGCRGAAAGAYDLGSLGHGVLNLKNVAAARALIFVARHNTSFSAQSGQIALPAKFKQL